MDSSAHPAYTRSYFEGLQDAALRSAEVVVPQVMAWVQPRRVIDVGCGVGAWLSVFKREGAEEVVGVDGPWVDPGLLEIDEERFRAADLREPLRLPVPLAGPFDLVVSLEVAEHLPPDAAEPFVDTLTRLGPVVLFSAAAPLQGGTDHVNEQWPAYWADRFAARGYAAVDVLRRLVWQDERVAWWYAQNMLFFVQEGHLERYPALRQRQEESCLGLLPAVHPGRLAVLHEQASEFEDWVAWLRGREAALEERVTALEELRPGALPLRRILPALPRLLRHALAEEAKRRFSRP